MQPISLYHRKSIRLKEYDYSSPAEYSVTICTKNKECVLSEIANEKVKLSPIGKIAMQCWEEIPQHFPNVELDAFIAMPNHIHGIIIINPLVGVHNYEPLQRHAFQHTIRKSLGSIIRAYKGAVKTICQNGGYSEFVWQRNYYEHIIRSDKELNNIRDYIINNPLKWFFDKENLVKEKL
jgi:REP element-mobilizing transposase RayT